MQGMPASRGESETFAIVPAQHPSAFRSTEVARRKLSRRFAKSLSPWSSGFWGTRSRPGLPSSPDGKNGRKDTDGTLNRALNDFASDRSRSNVCRDGKKRVFDGSGVFVEARALQEGEDRFGPVVDGFPDIKVGRSPGRSDQELCDLGRNRLIHGFFWDLPEQYFLASVDGRLRRPRSGWGACSAAAKSRRKVFNLWLLLDDRWAGDTAQVEPVR